jgi:hypothetical protein
MQQKGLWAKTVVLKLKSHEFDVWTRAASATSYFQDEVKIYNLAQPLLQSFLADRVSVRLMGVRATHFKNQATFQPEQGQFNIMQFLRRPDETSDASASRDRTTSSDDVVVGAKREFDLLATEEDDEEERQLAAAFAASAEECEETCDATASISSAEPQEQRPPPSSAYICPVCSSYQTDDLQQLNRHVDECLSLPVLSSYASAAAAHPARSSPPAAPPTHTRESSEPSILTQWLQNSNHAAKRAKTR